MAAEAKATLKSMKQAHTTAFLEVKKTASALTTSVKQGQSIIVQNLQKLESSWADFEFCHHEVVEHYNANQSLLEGETISVNGKDPETYHAHVKTFYDKALSVYNVHVQNQVSGDSVSLGASALPGLFMQSSLTQNSNPDSSFTRSFRGHQDPPSWDGKPGRSWLEFKVSWLTEIVPLYKGRQLALARLLRKQISGEGKKEIEHVSLSDPKCYDLMWSALVARFDNVALNVYVVLSVFDKLKACTEDDCAGTLAFFRRVNAAHAQLQSLKQVDEVDAVRVSRISSLLPRSFQMLWAKKLCDLNDVEKYHPFAKFKEFLDSHQSTLESMIDLSHTSKYYESSCISSSGTPAKRGGARVNATSAEAAGKACVLHPGGGTHRTIDCRLFVKMDPRERFNVANKFGLCKRCLEAKHGTCTISCKSCKKDTHHEMLCFKGLDSTSGKSDSLPKPYGSADVRPFNPPSNHAVQIVDQATGMVYNTLPPSQPDVMVSPAMQTSSFYQLIPGGSYPNPQIAHDASQIPHTGRFVFTSNASHDKPSAGQASSTATHERTSAGSVANSPQGMATVPGKQGTGPVALQPAVGVDASKYPHGFHSTPQLIPQYIEGLGVVYRPPATGACNALSTRPASASNYSHVFKTSAVDNKEQLVTDTKAYREHLYGLFSIVSCAVTGSKEIAIIFQDSGSDTTLINDADADRLGARVIKKGSMDMTTLHGTKTVPTRVVEVTLSLPDGTPFPIIGYTMPALCSDPAPLDEEVLKSLFPGFNPKELQYPSGRVSILMGADYFQLFPKRERASVGNLSVMESVLGLCVQGSHPRLVKSGIAGSHSGDPHPYHGVMFQFRESYHSKVCAFRTDIPSHAELRSSVSHPRLGPSHDGVLEEQISDRMSHVPGRDILPHSESVRPGMSSPARCTADSTEEEPPRMLPSLEAVQLSEDLLPDARDELYSTSTPDGDAYRHQPRYCPVTVAATRSSSRPEVEDFIRGENLGTACYPQCGACSCGRCPLPGHTYSFKEEQELALIQSKLRYDEERWKWVCGYPWIVDPRSLPDNYPAAYSTLLRTERTLLKEPEWMATYQKQIDDHVARGVARKLTQEEIDSYTGPYFYLSHMAVEQPKSESTPVRIVFNSSQKFQGVSLNDCLAKGPDAYNNSLLGMLIRFREHQTVIIGDIKKMYNTVELEEMEQHMHRFLWRSCEQDRKPEVWVITRVNLGDRPSGTIAITAKNNTAHMFSHIDEEAAVMIIYCSYTDDLINSIPEAFPKALTLTGKCEDILIRGGFEMKGWWFGGVSVPVEYKKKDPQQVLGSFYDSHKDCMFFPARVNFSKKKRNVPTGPNLTPADVPQGIPDDLTRRIVLAQVMGIYDPLGLLSPVVLAAKLLLRETWKAQLDWDETMSSVLVEDWKRFFTALFEAEKLEFSRCLTPENAVGNPQLIILSDGSEEAYGCAAYIRWQLADGTFWCTLIMAKSRIAPVNRVSIPQMELNGAVLNKRIREVITSESRFNFEKIHQFVDSETVLCQLYKVSQKFRVYEGVRIGEIQAATHGNMQEWGWVSTEDNVADLTTRPQPVSAIGPGSAWMSGPAFLYKPEEEWPVKRNPHVSATERSPGEKISVNCSNFCISVCVCFKVCTFHSRCHGAANKDSDFLFKSSISRCASTSLVLGAFSRIISAIQSKSFRGGNIKCVKPVHTQKALKCMLEEAQCSAWSSETEVRSHFRHVPIEFKDGLWVVASRDSRRAPLTPDHKPQVILPYSSPITYRLMRDAHNDGRHGGRDATLSRFRSRYHTSRAHRLADAVVKACYVCRLCRARLGKQKMGSLPPERVLRSPPFTFVVCDLFGPYMCRGDKNPRVCNLKVWGFIIVDLPSRAVHIEVTPGYDTGSFLISFRRYAAIRGWPSKVYSDPGTQLVGASAEVRRAWEMLQTNDVIAECLRKGTEWVFGPSDSPWYQGAAESLIKSAKTSIHRSIHGKHLSALELLSAFSEVANLLNERPIGFAPGLDNEINILTPNNLLLGRSVSTNPGGYQSDTSLLSRVTAVREIVDAFWSSWTELYAPTLLRQSKWTHEERPLRRGDIVLVADQNTVRGEYRLAMVGDVHPSRDGLVRRVDIEYVIYKSMTKDFQLVDGKLHSVPRSVQRLALIIPVEELPPEVAKKLLSGKKEEE